MEQLPVDCISCILALTSPKDVCRLAGVSSALRSAANSDFLWKTFLPADCREIIAQSSSSSSSFLNSLPEKALYFHLSDHPLLIGIGNSSFSLDKESSIICYMIGARDIHIKTGLLRYYFHSQSRFREVGEVEYEFEGRIDVKKKKLSPKIYYAAYLVFESAYTQHRPSEKEFRVLSWWVQEGKSMVRCWNPVSDYLTERADGWMEIQVSRVFVGGDPDNAASIRFYITTDHKSPLLTPTGAALIIQGIEIRPICKFDQVEN